MPIRLWSTVVSQEATRPRRQSARYGWAVSAPATTLRPLLRELLRVRDERVDLVAGPVLADGRHQPGPVAQQRLDPLAVAEQRVAAERRADVLVREAVARLADALPLLAPQRVRPRCRRALRDERLVLRARHDVDDAGHQRMLDAAELRAACHIVADRRVEPGVVRLAGDRVVLAAQVGHPPGVVDV